MALRKTFTDKAARGFTLIEVLIVLGLLVIVGGLGLVVSMDTFRSYSFRDERDLLVSALQKARSQAVSNMCFDTNPKTVNCSDGKPHGVYVDSANKKYVIFQGSSYTARDTAMDEDLKSVYPNVIRSGFTEVVFSTLSGNASTSPWTLSISDASGFGTSTITIGQEGQIRWTH